MIHSKVIKIFYNRSKTLIKCYQTLGFDIICSKIHLSNNMNDDCVLYFIGYKFLKETFKTFDDELDIEEFLLLVIKKVTLVNSTSIIYYNSILF